MRDMCRAIAACIIGSIFEWYDFALYGYFASIIGRQFFPSEDPLVSIISAFGVFAAGFAIRPVGAILFGHIGDKYGRKKALVITIFLMTFPTGILGLLPTYAQIGVTAPILLIIVRLLQGLSIGGNSSGVFTFVTEYAPPNRRGFVGSLTLTSVITGILLGSGVVTFLSYNLSEEALISYGWRMPFIAGSLIGLLGFYLRRKIPETPQFQEAKKNRQETASHAPLKELFKYNSISLLRAVLILVLNDVGFYISFIYVATYLTTFVGMPMDHVMSINTMNMLVIIFFIPIMGWLSDKIGRKPLMMASCLLFFAGSIPSFHLFDTADYWSVFWGQSLFAFAISMYFGTMATVLVEKFPTSSRYTGLAISLNITAAVFGGTAPLVVSYLIDLTKMQHMPAYYLMFGAILSMVGLLFLKDRYKEPLL